MKENPGIMASAMVCFFLLHGIGMAQTKASDPVRFSGDVGVSFTNNRDSSTEKDENTDFFVRPKINAEFQWERLTLDVYYGPSYRWRSNPSRIQNETELFHELGVEAEFSLSPRIKPWIYDFFNYTDYPAVSEGGTQLRRDASYIMNRIQSGVTYEFTRLVHVRFSGNHMIKRYDDDLVAGESDEDRMGGGVHFWHQFARTMGWMAHVDYQQYAYDNDEFFVRDFSTVIFSFGVEKVFGPKLRGSVLGGWQEGVYEDSSLSDVSEPFLRCTVQGSMPPFSIIRTELNYSVRDSDAYPFASQQSLGIDLHLEWMLPGSMLLGVGSRYHIGDYKRDALPDGAVEADVAPVLSGEKTTTSVSASVGYRLDDHTAVRLTQWYENVDSDVDVTYNRTATSLVLTREF